MPDIIEIARVCHAANKSLCECMGDYTQDSWDKAEQWQRDSAIKGVAFALANPDATPADQHNAWIDDKLTNGWRYGPVKDANALPPTHPCMMPYEKLPIEQRMKDHAFRAIVWAMSHPDAA